MPRPVFVLSLFVTLLCLSLTVQAPDPSCSGVFNGNTYDLTGAMVGNGYKGSNDSGPNTFFFTPCENSPLCANSQPGTPTPSPVCQEDGNSNFHGCGLITPAVLGELIPTGTGFYMYFANGDGTRSGPRTANVTCLCASGSSELGPLPGQLYELNGTPNIYGLQFTSPYCCPNGLRPGVGGGGFDYGWIFVIIVFSAAAVYLLGGVIVNRFVFHHEGLQMIPNVDFWVASPGLMKDGVMYVVNKVRGGQSGYSRV